MDILETEVPERIFGFLKCVLGDYLKTSTRKSSVVYLTMPIGNVIPVMYLSVVGSF